MRGRKLLSAPKTTCIRARIESGVNHIGPFSPIRTVQASRSSSPGPLLRQHLSSTYPQTRPPSRSKRFFATTMASARDPLNEVLTPSRLEDVRKVWFGHLPDQEHHIVPGPDDVKHWFSKNQEFDETCVTRFRRTLEAIQQSECSSDEILAAANPTSPLDWLSVLLLLDQVPRNCYRGDEATIVFKHFDPLATRIASKAMDAGVLKQSSLVRYRLAHRLWFLLPFMHSEDVALHERALREFDAMDADVDDMIRAGRDLTGLSADELWCREVLLRNRKEAKKFVAMCRGFEERHYVVVKRFGRYPHRNAAVGRTPTKEEIEYLENGGETFS